MKLVSLWRQIEGCLHDWIQQQNNIIKTVSCFHNIFQMLLDSNLIRTMWKSATAISISNSGHTLDDIKADTESGGRRSSIPGLLVNDYLFKHS